MSFILHKELNVGQTFNTSRHSILMVCRIGQYFDFIIVSVKNGPSHKYIVQDGRSMPFQKLLKILS